jgi:hypothetical protein
MKLPWDVVVVSASTQNLANAACDELRASWPDLAIDTRLLAVADPSREHRVGAGGALLNALLVVGEALSARGGLTTLSVKPLSTSRIIILQLSAAARGGCPHPCLPMGLTAVPAAEGGTLACGVCYALHAASVLFAEMPPGLAIASTDGFVALGPDAAPLPFAPGAADAGVVVTVPVTVAQAAPHGVCVTAASDGHTVPSLDRVLYRGSAEQARHLHRTTHLPNDTSAEQHTPPNNSPTERHLHHCQCACSE